ncbi:hypothetical protein NDU88_007736 [Pleurodeles waltl]|uniref:Helix-turn-helix domain-containing protein n=1 Tax=Pleurodeles waltl TaxID=8319 RepID=A0AAV7NUG3_PLEWA|nr:hypothetical protein NDU88_007736 [Pleurodeles waltl]
MRGRRFEVTPLPHVPPGNIVSRRHGRVSPGESRLPVARRGRGVGKEGKDEEERESKGRRRRGERWKGYMKGGQGKKSTNFDKGSSVDHFERHVVLHEDNPYRDQIKLLKRYLDDVLLIWTGNKEEALAFAVWLNGANPFLTFTMNIGDNKLPFFDLLIYEHDGGLATEVYYKPTDCNNLLQYQSFHPRALRDNLPVGQFLRLRRNCSSMTDYRKHADKLTTKLHTKDYPPHLVSRARKRARNNNRDQLLQPRALKSSLEKIVCVTTFNPLSNEIQKIIRDNWKILTSGGLPFEPPLHTYKRASNIRNIVVHTRPKEKLRPTQTTLWQMAPPQVIIRAATAAFAALPTDLPPSILTLKPHGCRNHLRIVTART